LLRIDAITHLVDIKTVGEFVNDRLNTIIVILNLLQLMKKYDVKKYVLSSSATVHGRPVSNPIYEHIPKKQ